MGYLVIDTETSGLFDFSKPADAPGQPRLAALAAARLADPDDPEPEYHRHMIRPDGWAMDPEAERINNLSTERLMAEGVPIRDVLEWYSAAILRGDVIVAYNAQFDTKIMRAELRRAGMPDLFTQTPNICVMKGMKAIMGGWRYPKLSIAARHAGFDLKDAHDPTADVEAAVAIFRYLHRADALPPPTVKYAKRRPAQAAG